MTPKGIYFREVYLDNAATMPVDPQVLAVMQPYFTENYGNASSLHVLGVRAKKALEGARIVLASEFRFTTQAEIDYTIDRVASAVRKLRRISPIGSKYVY